MRVWTTLLTAVLASVVSVNMAFAQKNEAPKKPKPTIEELFKEFDTNNDGVLSLEEVKEGIEKMKGKWEAKKDSPKSDKSHDKDGHKGEKQECPKSEKKHCPMSEGKEGHHSHDKEGHDGEKNECDKGDIHHRHASHDKDCHKGEKKECPVSEGTKCPLSDKKECPNGDKKECPMSEKKEAAKKPHTTADERFKEMDANNDGRIAEADFIVAHKNWPEAKAKEIYKKMGGTEEKGLTLEQYRTAREAWHKKMAEQKEKN
jgi:Ca2+-binding EF-hand superfamily protein